MSVVQLGLSPVCSNIAGASAMKLTLRNSSSERKVNVNFGEFHNLRFSNENKSHLAPFLKVTRGKSIKVTW